MSAGDQVVFVSACQLDFISSLVHLVFLNSFTVVRIKCSLKASANQMCSHLLESIGSHCNDISTKHVVLFSHYIFMIWLAYKEVEQLRAELQERRLPSQWPQLKTLFQHFNMFDRKLHIFEARKSDTGDEKSGHLSRVCGDKNGWFWQELWMISNHDRGEENWTFLIWETLPYPGGCFACKPNQSMSAALSQSEDLRHVITVIQSVYFGFLPSHHIHFLILLISNLKSEKKRHHW